MTRPFSVAFKQKMVQRLTGKDAVSAIQLSRETGVRLQNRSRWLQEARSLPFVAARDATEHVYTLEQKARVLVEAANLRGEPLHAYLEREGIKLADFERWRIALQEDGGQPRAASRRIRQLERELARKEKALAEAAALLVQKNDHEGALQRGRRRRRSERELILSAIGKAQSGGARLRQARQIAGISARTIERWGSAPHADGSGSSAVNVQCTCS